MNISDLETQMSEALEDYFKIVELQKHENLPRGPSFQLHFERLDKLTAQLSAESDPQLCHFMIRKSYQKALEFLRQKKG